VRAIVFFFSPYFFGTGKTENSTFGFKEKPKQPTLGSLKKKEKKKENTFGFEGETKNRLAVFKHKRINKPAFGLEKLKTQR